MEIANVRLRLNKLGSDVPLKDVTPAEAMFLHILHGPYNGGLTFGEEFSKIEVVGTAKVATGKTNKIVVKEATEQKIIKGAMLKPAVPAQIVPGDVIKATTPETKVAGKPAVGTPGTPGYVAGTPDIITPAQPEVRTPGYQIAAQDAVYAPDQIIPAVDAVVKEEPILVNRTNQQELVRLRNKYNGARTKENKPIIDAIWVDRLNPQLPQTFKEINWTEIAQATAGIETAPVNYVTDANFATTGGIAKTLQRPMRNQTLANVLYKLKAELRKTLDTTATAEDTTLYQLIETGQQELADAYNWGFLKSRWDSFLPPGTRFATFPTGLSPQGGAASANAAIDLNRPFLVQVKWNQIWQPVQYGIDEQPEFNYLDSDRGQLLDPVQRWQLADTGQFEVWPLPATTAQLRFTQNRVLTSLQTGATTPPTWNTSATLDLDDVLVMLYVAMSIAPFEKKNNVQSIAMRLKERLRVILGDNPIRTETIAIGQGMPTDRKAIRLVPMVLVAGNTK